MDIQYVYWQLTSWLKKLGAWGLIGLLLLMITLLFYLVKIPETQTRIETAKAALKQQSARRDAQAAKQRPTMQNAEEEVQDFYSRFPTVDGLPAILGQLHKIAKQQSLTLVVGDYQYKALKTKRKNNVRELTKYKIVLPVDGSYTKIRAFIAESLQAMPELALMDLQVVREDSQSRDVAARVAFVVFVRGEAWSN